MCTPEVENRYREHESLLFGIMVFGATMLLEEPVGIELVLIEEEIRPTIACPS